MRCARGLAILMLSAALPVWAQHGGSSAHTGSGSGHSGSGGTHFGSAGHVGMGGSRSSSGGMRNGFRPLSPGGVPGGPPHLGINRPAPPPHGYAGQGYGGRSWGTNDGHGRMPYAPWDHDRGHNRGWGLGWGAGPYYSGWVTPWIPNYPLFYGDTFDQSVDGQYPADQAGYDAAQPYAEPYAGEAAGEGYPAYGPQPDAPPAQPAPPGTQASAPYQPSSELAPQRRPPYHPARAEQTIVSSTVPESMVTLVFKDGRPPEKIRNYLLTSTTLSVLDQHRHDIPVNELDLVQTAKVNREAGIDFQLPGPARP